MASRLLSIAFISLGLVLLAATAAVYWVEADGQGVTIDDADRELAVDRPGETTVIGFTVHNPTRHAVQVVGIADC